MLEIETPELRRLIAQYLYAHTREVEQEGIVLINQRVSQPSVQFVRRIIKKCFNMVQTTAM